MPNFIGRMRGGRWWSMSKGRRNSSSISSCSKTVRSNMAVWRIGVCHTENIHQRHCRVFSLTLIIQMDFFFRSHVLVGASRHAASICHTRVCRAKSNRVEFRTESQVDRVESLVLTGLISSHETAPRRVARFGIFEARKTNLAFL